MNMYPRPVREIHQIELSTRCQLRCHYCPHYPKLPRAKEDMSWEIFERSMVVVKHFCDQGTQTELSLTGIGESLLHPRFVEMCTVARQIIGWNRPLVVTTNGIDFTEEIAKHLAALKASVFVSLHRPEKAAFAMHYAKKAGVFAKENNSFATSSFDWAGHQKNWTEIRSAPKIKCDFLGKGWAVILVDGRVATCCLDATGASSVGSINDDPSTLTLKPWGDEKVGCAKCHMSIPGEE